jgi:hypothetical protein
VGRPHGRSRDRRGRRAGPDVEDEAIGASSLVALASATFVVVSTHFVSFQPCHKDDLVTVEVVA